MDNVSKKMGTFQRLLDFSAVKKKLEAEGFEIISERELCSSGIFGPLFKIKIRDNKTGEEKYIIERTFTEVKDIERRFSLIEERRRGEEDSEPRYKIINWLNKEKDKLVIDYLYNEERALSKLQILNGIPKFYGTVYDDLTGSTLEEFIDGDDLSLMFLKEGEFDNKNLSGILEKLKMVYIQAAEMGYIHGDPTGSTVMVDKQGEPYLTDWYLYARGSIEKNPEINKLYLSGLDKISNLQQQAILNNN